MRTFEVDEAQHAYILAERDAIVLLALSSATVPSGRAEIKALFRTRITEEAIRFAINARRYLELTNERPMIQQVLRPLASARASVAFVDSLWDALNGILHARYLNVSFHRSPIEGFPIGDTEWAAVLAFETDRRPRFLIDIYSMAWAFLEAENSDPAPQV